MGGTLEFLEMALRLSLAVLFGGILGWEREEQRKPAGLRTHMLVALGASSVTLAALYLAQPGFLEGDDLQLDPTRVIEGVIGGIGFLGAGSIIRSRGSVEGITTAASIWVAGALGVASGLGMHTLAIMTVALAFIILRLIGIAEKRYTKKGVNRARKLPS